MQNTNMSREHDQQSKSDKVKQSAPYSNEYSKIEPHDILQGIDIIVALRQEAAASGNKVAWNKLLHATEHLERLLRDHMGTD